MKDWYRILTPFYVIRGAIRNFGYGFVFVYVCRLNPIFNGKLLVLLSLGMLCVWLFTKLIFSIFESVIYKHYKEDSQNWKESGVVLNKETKKLEPVNHLITISEKYLNPNYRKYLKNNFGFLLCLMVVFGMIVAMITPIVN